MFICITDKEVYMSHSYKALNKKMNALIPIDDFKKIGTNYISILSSEDLSFVRDLKKMSAIPISNLYKKDTTTFYIIVCILVLNIIQMFV